MPIATFEDLAAAMSLLDASNNPGLSPELQHWIEDVFMVVNDEKVNKQRERERADKQFEKQDVFVETADLIEKHKELSNSIKNSGGYKEENSKQLLQKYLYPAIGAGYIEDERMDGRKAKRYRLIKPLKYSFYSFTDEKNIFPYRLKMKVENQEQLPTKKTLELQISTSLKYSSNYSLRDKINFKIVNVDDNEISIAKLVEKYLHNPEDYFVCLNKNGKNKADSKFQEKEKTNYIEKGQKEEHCSKEENDNKLQEV